MQSDYSRPTTAATCMTGSSSVYHSSAESFAYSVISNKFQSTGEAQVLLLPKVNARRSIKFSKSTTGPKIMAVRETAQWLISNNNRMTDELSKECRQLDDSYLKWYRKHFNEKKDVLEKVSNLLSHAKKEKHERCRSYQSCYKSMSTPGSRTRSRHVTHNRASFFATELPLPDVEQVDTDKAPDTGVDQNEATGEPAAADALTATSPRVVAAKSTEPDMSNGTVKTSENGKSPVKNGRTVPEKNGKTVPEKNRKAADKNRKSAEKNAKAKEVRIISPSATK